MKYRLFSIILSLLPICVYSQIDTTYIKEYTQLYSIRINYFDDFTGIRYSDGENVQVFKDNNPVKLGIGVSWKTKSLRFSHGINWFQNKDKGSTETYDFKYHSYKPSYFYDVVIQQIKGFYKDGENSDGTYNLFPDLNLRQVNLHGQYVFNNKKYSFKASFGQSEKQLKSAGSFLVGGGVYYNRIKSDSLSLKRDSGFRRETLQIGASGGYGYTWVINSHWYLTGVGNIGFNVGTASPWSKPFKHSWFVYPTFYVRTATGYDINSWSFAGSFIWNRTRLLKEGSNRFNLNEGTFQLTAIKRINWDNEWLDKALSKVFDEWLSIF